MFCITDLKKNIKNVSFCSFSLFSSNKVLGMDNIINHTNYINFNVNTVNNITNINDFIFNEIKRTNNETIKIFKNIDFNVSSTSNIKNILDALVGYLNQNNNDENKKFVAIEERVIKNIPKGTDINNLFKLKIGEIIHRNIITNVDLNLKNSNNINDNINNGINNGILNTTLFCFYERGLCGCYNSDLFDREKVMGILEKTVNTIKSANRLKIKVELENYKINKKTNDNKLLCKKTERETKEKQLRGRKLITNEELNIPENLEVTDDFIIRCISDRNQLLYDKDIMKILSKEIYTKEDYYILFLKSIIFKKYFENVIREFKNILKKIDENLLKRLEFKLSRKITYFSTEDLFKLFATNIESFFRLYIDTTTLHGNIVSIHTILTYNNKEGKYKDIFKFFSTNNYDFYKKVFFNKEELKNLSEILNNTPKPIMVAKYFGNNHYMHKINIIIIATYLYHFSFQENILSSKYYVERVMFPKISKNLIISNNSIFKLFDPNIINNNNIK